ncbi:MULTISPECIES: hypothetical protein [unclassified Candidatus Frackibacter]|uniref:hypothetical protein n=1 Tax=unclassified Candidatus Frackibacter TaxID=2648818 RepID=UPI0008869A74|nr:MULTISPECIES: hypothetical protein [unclassified Candidatus Frackibacter]SDB97117.1 hypothetical protein SAMN04515661_10170 [Candidatus Frackibacter sp. WG11]SEM28771.1 hypothetical protein SAMN04488698_10171 [Candidatus Frackibacter sp. WG12]SFL33622.1 hypothetical protein SAMN04488699_10172 [Candidatus Frackibacter sp. WG13]
MEYKDELQARIKEVKKRLTDKDINQHTEKKLKEELQTLLLDYNELQAPQKVTVEDTNHIPYAVFDAEDVNKYYE